MNQPQKVELGQQVRCKISGVEGIATAIAEFPHASNQVSIQRGLDKDGKVQDEVTIDAPQLEIINATPIFEVTITPPIYDFGTKVRCIFTNFEGKIAGRCLYLNGCTRILIQPPHDPKRDLAFQKGVWFAEGAVEPVGKWAPPKEKQEPAKSKPGGPALRYESSTPKF